MEATDTIDIQFDFSEPSKVSRGSQPDVIVITVEDKSFFSLVDGSGSIESGTEIKI